METIKQSEVIEIFRNKFGLTQQYIEDKEYILPSIELIKKILLESRVDTYKYIAETFDCDDFAIKLFSMVKDYQYENLMKFPFCFGFCKLKMPYSEMHIMNICITDKKQILLIEPQKDQIILVDDLVKIKPYMIFI